MKRIVLICGLIAGLIVSTFMVSSIAYSYSSDSFGGSSMLVGYASMILAFSLIFVGVRNYRDKHNNGVISFAQALKIGLLITLIASSIYVLAWTIDYYFFIPDFMDKYMAYTTAQAKASGASAAEIQSQIQDMETSAKLYDTPLGVILLTYLEILPVGLLVSLLCALILKRKQAVA